MCRPERKVALMIVLTRLDDTEFYLSVNMIETIEETPNTVITVTSGKIFIVKESAKEIISKMVVFYRMIYDGKPQILSE